MSKLLSSQYIFLKYQDSDATIKKLQLSMIYIHNSRGIVTAVDTKIRVHGCRKLLVRKPKYS